MQARLDTHTVADAQLSVGGQHQEEAGQVRGEGSRKDGVTLQVSAVGSWGPLPAWVGRESRSFPTSFQASLMMDVNSLYPAGSPHSCSCS